jgi:thiamine kinase-like enzyme
MNSLMQDSRLSAIRAKIPLIANATNITLLNGGLTNQNYRVETDEGIYVLRVSDPASSLLGINRENECINTARAQQAGVGPTLWAALPLENALVISWIEAQTLHPTHLQSQPELLSRIASSLRVLHGGPKFQGHFHFPTLRSTYLKTVLNAGYYLPDKYLSAVPLVLELEELMTRDPENEVPCHNDLLAENFLDDGDKIWIIDYEFSGQNEASFELGNLASESSLNDDQINFLCDVYWQRHLPSKIARAKAWSMIARFGWVLWASIQEGISTIDFDFRSWGIEKWNLILPDLQGEKYQRVLENLKKFNT